MPLKYKNYPYKLSLYRHRILECELFNREEWDAFVWYRLSVFEVFNLNYVENEWPYKRYYRSVKRESLYYKLKSHLVHYRSVGGFQVLSFMGKREA